MTEAQRKAVKEAQAYLDSLGVNLLESEIVPLLVRSGHEAFTTVEVVDNDGFSDTMAAAYNMGM